MPRRARHLIPMGLPRRGEVVAGWVVAILLAHLLLAQLTLVLAAAFAGVGKVSRWRLSWLLAPAVTGLAWTLLIGPDKALAGLVAGPSGILWHLSGGHLAGAAAHRLAGFAGAQRWLPRQVPVALITGAAEAALVGWLDWLHTDEWAVPPPRPGLITAARHACAANAIRAGAVLTRDGCALGIVPSTGAIAELGWAEVSRGTLIVGAAARDVTLTGLQVIHAALRRRKPVIVLDHGDEAVARAVAAACQATGTPLLTDGVPGAYLAGCRTRPADQPAVDLVRVARERLAALVLADSREPAGRACARLSSLATDLRRIGVDGDALVWVPRGERVPAQALAAFLRGAPEAGVSVVIGTTSAEAAAELSGLTGAALIYRVADRDLAARLATRTGTWLLPAQVAGAVAGQRPDADRGQDLVPSPVIPARRLLTLGQAQFVLAVDGPRQRLVALGRLVPARLPGARP